MRAIIADDENLVRASLKSMLEEADLPVRVVGEATDGHELVSLVGKFLPDIAFVDIKMPGLNGLEAIKASKKLSPCTQWIILTGFKEFDYAREALSLGAACYLLKPVSPKELEQTLKKAMEDIDFLYHAQNIGFESELISIAGELSSLSEMDEDCLLKRSNFQSILFIFDSFLEEREKAQKQLEFCKAVRAIINENPDSRARLAFFTLPQGEPALVGAWDTSKSIDGRDVVLRHFRRIEALLKLYSMEDFSVTVITCDESSSPESLMRSLNQMHNLSALRVIGGHGKIFTLHELNNFFKGCPPELLELCDILLRLASAYSEKAYAQFMKSLDDLEKKACLRKIPSNPAALKSVTGFLAHSIGYTLSPGQEPGLWLKNIKRLGERMLLQMRKEDHAPQDIMNRVLLCIEQNYSKDFGLAQIAEQFDVTPNYLSALFHKKMGTTFMNYMTGIRMVKARELLANPNAKVQQVAEHLGYCSSRHFSRVYKKFYGCYPSEFANSLQQQ